MEFVCSILCELPFMLNLPHRVYTVMAEGSPFDLEVLQEQVAAHFGPRDFVVGDPATLRQQFGERFDRVYHQPLRTILRHTLLLTVDASDLPAVTDNDVLDDVKSSIIGENPTAYAGDQQGLSAEANRRWGDLTAEDQATQRLLTAKRRYSRKLADTDRYLAGVNDLVRLYMQQFNGFFVEEVAVHQLASQDPIKGIYVIITSEGELVQHHGVVERFPPIMRRPWLNHSQTKIDQFKTDLRNGLAPEPISLLAVRARSFLQRGAYQSSIIEASAALDLSLSTKIWEGHKCQGRTDADIESILRANIRFEDRAKSMFRDATGKTAASLDNTLWSRVVGHRTKFRHGVAHSDAEPPKVEAEHIVEDFLQLADLVKKVVPHAAIRLRAFQIGQKSGSQHGHDLTDWLAAETELLSAAT